jgi:hypothetical protein
MALLPVWAQGKPLAYSKIGRHTRLSDMCIDIYKKNFVNSIGNIEYF